ncbi:MAG TPA: nuclear transport factor 2 family protein [Solirubrobacterales bacterium]|jgi:ketosteroid isomerase-like protein|nr:nuclear transport factor 2 family protein [Solirubrobacterales bacterium]
MTNVELTREFWRLWNDRDLRELVSRYDDFFTEDLEWHSPVTEVAGGRVIGRRQFEEHVTDLLAAFDEISADLEEAVELAPDVVRSSVWIHGKGANSGAAIDSPLLAISRLRGGRVAWAWGSFDIEAAQRVADAITKGEEVAI